MSATTPFAGSPPPLRKDASLMGLVGLAHLISHFSQLLLPPLFPWLKDAFQVSYAELGMLLTIFFVVSCSVQTLSGFLVDRVGPRPVLFAGLAVLGLAAFGYSISTSYAMLALFSGLAGVGNGVFHPVDYTLLNRKVHASRLGHAFSVHGITGSLGWALAPAMMVSIALAFTWRIALASAGVLAFVVMIVLWLHRSHLTIDMTSAAPMPATRATKTAASTEGNFAFLAIPAVWMCFGFFFLYAVVLSGVQAFAPEAARQLHDVPDALGRALPHLLHGRERRRHGARWLPRVRPNALREDHRHGLRPRRDRRPDDRLRAAVADDCARALRRDGRRRRRRRARRAIFRQARGGRERERRPRLRRRLFGPRHRPGRRAPGVSGR